MTSSRIALVFIVLITLVLTIDTASADRWSGPTNLTATLSDGSVSLSWTPGTNPRYIKQVVKRREARATTWTSTDVSLTASSYTDNGVQDGRKYIYRVRAEKANGKGRVSNVAYADIAITLSAEIASISDDIPDYDRDDWGRWMDADGDCQDARHEVLIAESVVPVTYKTENNCDVATGEWVGPYRGTTITNPSSVDIDHMVPLKNAHISGGHAWDSDKKKSYYNYLDDPQHLIATSRGGNRSKGSRGPEEWKPDLTSYHCQYAIDWTSIKATWELTMTSDEANAIDDMLDTCSGTVNFETTGEELQEVEEIEDNPVYSSCEAAEEAGEERIQGSQGSGKGFPKEMVPSEKDGDGDGVVCEK